MEVRIDIREKALLDEMEGECVDCKLDVGDIHFVSKDTGRCLCIVERKTWFSMWFSIDFLVAQQSKHGMFSSPFLMVRKHDGRSR